ncbi:kyphoscoliosis peptidase-like [Lineus longissimus]|uniref:kyphoscoliosis peptidase-like n=1 Tax=Lineus longissimus TaxID=88925 RepID=UPI00315D6201
MGCSTSKTTTVAPYPGATKTHLSTSRNRRHPGGRQIRVVPASHSRPLAKKTLNSEQGQEEPVQKRTRRDSRVVTEDDLVWSGKKALIPRLSIFKAIDQRAIAAPDKLRTKPAELVAYLTAPCKTELEKFRAIFRWVASHMRYDVESLETGIRASQRADDCMASGKAVCAGFSGVLGELCRHINVQLEDISGCSKGGEYRAGETKRYQISGGMPTKTDHVWNIVHISGERFLCDPTWAAGSYRWEGGKKMWKTFWEEGYFLADPEGVFEDHWPMGNGGHNKQLLKSPRKNFKDWLGRPHMKTSSHTLGVVLLSHKEGTILTDKNEIDIEFTSKYQLKTSTKLETLKGKTWTEFSGFTLTYREGEMYKIRVRIPERGNTFILKVLGRLLEADDNLTEKGFFIVSYNIVGSSQTVARPFHSDFCERLGIEADALKLGFKLDDKSPMVQSKAGEEKISITLPSSDPISLKCRLRCLDNNLELDDQCYSEKNADRIVCHIRMYDKGEYALFVFANLQQTDNTRLAMLGNFFINCISPLPSRLPAFPKHYRYNGPEPAFHELGMVDLNGNSSIKKANNDGTCHLTFQIPSNLPLFMVLYDHAGHDIRERRVCGVLEKGIMTAMLKLPHPGNFTLGICKKQEGTSANNLAFYMIENHGTFHGELFPVVHDLIGPLPRAAGLGLTAADKDMKYYIKTSKLRHSLKFFAPAELKSFAILTYRDRGREDVRPAVEGVADGIVALTYAINLPFRGIFSFQIWERSSPTKKLIGMLLEYQ